MQFVIRIAVADFKTREFSKWWNDYWTLVALSHSPNEVSFESPSIEKAQKSVDLMVKLLNSVKYKVVYYVNNEMIIEYCTEAEFPNYKRYHTRIYPYTYDPGSAGYGSDELIDSW